MQSDNDLDTNTQTEPVEYFGGGYVYHRTRARLLAEINGLSDDTYISTKHAAAYLGTSREQLANWRMLRRGPPFIGGDTRFIRYKISDLKAYMQSLMKTTRR